MAGNGNGWYWAVVGLAVSIGVAVWCRSVLERSGIEHPLPTLLPTPPPRIGPFAQNEALQGIEKIGIGRLSNPEDLAVDEKGNLYVGCADGWIKKIAPDGTIINWTRVGGRPLGLAMGLHGELLVCEPTMGLLNVTEGEVHVLTDNFSGLQFKFTDGLDVAKDGMIYFTDASTKYGYGLHGMDVLEARPNGHLYRFDPQTRATTLLAKDLYFPNGVAVSDDQKSVIFCETSKVRCQRYWLEGEKKGKIEIFIDNLPGYPDNVHRSGRGTFWIGLLSTRSKGMEIMFRWFPFLKHLVADPEKMDNLLGAKYMAKVLEVRGETGEALRLVEDPIGLAIGFVTCGLQVGNHLYVGGLSSDYIGKLTLSPEENYQKHDGIHGEGE